MRNSLEFETICTHGHNYYDSKYGVFKVPVYQTVICEFLDKERGLFRVSDRGFDLKYAREENITVRCLERILAKLEYGEDSLVFNSGMAAISSIYLALLDSESKVVIGKECYGTTQQLIRDLAEKFKFKIVLAGPDTNDIIDAIDSNTRFVFVESMTNPLLRVLDISEIAKRCSEVESILIVDNTFTTPILYNPLTDSASIVVHSTTKYISGHNDVLGGAIISSTRYIRDLWDWRRKLGGIISPYDAFLTIRGLATLKIRFEKQSRNAFEIARYLRDHPKVEEVYYPGLDDNPYHSIARRLFKYELYGGVVSFKIKGSKSEVMKLLMNLKLIKVSPSFGGIETLISYPILSAAKTISEEVRRELGITDNLLRLSMGLEDLNDIIRDLDNALSKI